MKDKLRASKTGDTLHGTIGKVSFNTRADVSRVTVGKRWFPSGVIRGGISLACLMKYEHDNFSTMQWRFNGDDLRLYVFYSRFRTNEKVDKAAERIIIKIK